MNDATFLLVRESVAIAAIIGATILALKKREGWGWLVFLAFVSFK